jgi:hypothetical protein
MPQGASVGGKAEWDSRTSVAAPSEQADKLELLRDGTELASVFPSFKAVHSAASLAALVSATVQQPQQESAS